MGYALIGAEGLAVALLCLALATGWAARGRFARWLWAVIVFLVFSGAAALVAVQYLGSWEDGKLIRTPWFAYALAWLVAFTVLGVSVLRRGLRRPGPGLARPAAAWPRGRLWLWLGGAVLALGLTFWNLDLAARADLAIARQEAGALLLDMTAPPVPEPENAARVYSQAVKDLVEPINDPWQDAVYRGRDPEQNVDWKDPHVVELVRKHEDALALLRKAAAMPRCSFESQRALDLRFLVSPHPEARKLRQGTTLLAVDARVKATQGNLARAFEDVSAVLGMVRHTSEFSLFWGRETVAWRTLEDVLRLAPPGKEPLPALTVPDLIPLVRKTHEEHAIVGMVGPVAASQPSAVLEEVSRDADPLTAFAVETVGVPAARVLLIPDELAAMRKLFDAYRKSPRSSADETPGDWAELRKAVETDPTSLFGVMYIKPKQKKLLSDASELAALRQTSRAGLAVAGYHRKHGEYPRQLEQLVPEFLPAVPVDPRDGQVLRFKRFPDAVVLYAPQDSAAAEDRARRGLAGRSHPPTPIFRLYPHGPGK